MSYTFGRVAKDENELLELVKNRLDSEKFVEFIKKNINQFNEQDPIKVKDKLIEIVKENLENFATNELDVDFDLNLHTRLDEETYREIKNHEREEIVYSHADINTGKLIFKPSTFVTCKSFYIDPDEYEDVFKVPAEIGITFSNSYDDYALFLSYMLEEEYDENNNPKYEIHLLF